MNNKPIRLLVAHLLHAQAHNKHTTLYFLGNIIEPFPKKIQKCVKSVQMGLRINFRHLVGQPSEFIEDGGGRSLFWTIGGWILSKSTRLERFCITKFSMASNLSIWRVNLLISLRTVEDGAGFGLLEAEFRPKVIDSQGFASQNSAWHQVWAFGGSTYWFHWGRWRTELVLDYWRLNFDQK